MRSVIYLGFLLDGQWSRPDPACMDELLKKPPPANHSAEIFPWHNYLFPQVWQGFGYSFAPIVQLAKEQGLILEGSGTTSL